MAKYYLDGTAIQVYECIEKWHSLEGRSPAIRRIANEIGVASTGTVKHHIDRLIRFQWIRREIKGGHYNLVPIRYPRVYYRRTE